MNVALEYANMLERWRNYGSVSGHTVLKAERDYMGVSENEVLLTATRLLHETNRLHDELERRGNQVDHFAHAKSQWTRAAFMRGTGWSSAGHGPDNIIGQSELGLLRVLGYQYDSVHMMLQPASTTVQRIIEELRPIREFIESSEIAGNFKNMLLSRVESVEALLSAQPIDFTSVISKMAEVLGMLLIVSATIEDPEEAKKWSDKARAWAGAFGKDLTISLISGVAIAVAQQSIGA